MGRQRFAMPPAAGIAAAIVALVSGLVFSRLILGLPPDVGQFSKYPAAALQYLHGAAEPERLLDFSPLYLGLHIAAFRFFQHPLQVIPWTQIVLLSLTATLLFLILRRQFGAALALAGVTAFVLGKSVAVYGHVFEPEPLVVFLLTAVVYFACRDDLPGAAAAGVSVALCVLTRPSFLPLAAAVPVYFWLRLPDRKRLLIALALFAVPVLVGVVYLAQRGRRLQGEASLQIMNPGTVFFDGNSPLATGGGAAYPPLVSDLSALYPEESDYQHAIYRLLARESTGRSLTPMQANRFWANKAADYIRDFPGRFLTLAARRTLYVFHGYRWDDLRVSWAAGRALEERGVPFVPFALVSALGALGLVTGRGSWREYFLPYAVFVNQAAVMVLVYATDRQRVSLYPFFVFFAVAAAAGLAAASWRRRCAGLALLAPLLFAFTVESDRMRDNRHVWEGFARQRRLASDGAEGPGSLQRSARLLALGPWALESARPAGVPVAPGQLAALAVQELPALRPDDPSTRLDRALLLVAAGRLDEAETVLTALEREENTFERLNGRIPYPAYHLGRIAVLRGNRDAAVRHFQRALAGAPGDPAVLAQLACLTDDATYAGRVSRYVDDLDARLLLGAACLDDGRPQVAAAYLEPLPTLLPDYVKGRILLAAALGASGEDVRAAETYLPTGEPPPEPVLLEERIVPIFERLAQGGTPEALYRYGVVLRQYGRFPEALRAFTQAAAAGFPAAAEDLRDLRTLLERPSPP